MTDAGPPRRLGSSGGDDDTYVIVPEDGEGAQGAPPSDGIQLRGVYKSFGDNHVLRGIDFTVERGTTTVLVGGSGTGKSVTLKHMVGLLKPDGGRVFVDGEDITDFSEKQLVGVRRKFGYLFQSTALISWLTCFENVALPLRELSNMPNDEVEERVMAKLAMLDVDRAAALFPSQISGGMKKRVGLARALIWDPEFVLFDEPTSGLDPVVTAIVDQMVIECREKTNVTSVMVTHDMASARRVADTVIMLYEGRVIEQGPPEQFMDSSHPIVRQFVRGELEGPITDRMRELERERLAERGQKSRSPA